MTKIKTLGAALLLVAAVTAPAFAQDGGRVGGRYGWEPSSSWNSEMPGMNSVGRNSEVTEPGDFAVTDGLSGRSRFGSSMGQVAPGTSNAVCGNCGGE